MQVEWVDEEEEGAATRSVSVGRLEEIETEGWAG
jgi:hypothetical protein